MKLFFVKNEQKIYTKAARTVPGRYYTSPLWFGFDCVGGGGDYVIVIVIIIIIIIIITTTITITIIIIIYPITGLERLLGVQEVEAPRISRQSANEGGKAVSPTHRPPLSPKHSFGTHFC